MDAPERGALLLVRFTSVALAGLSIVQMSLYVLDLHFHGHPIPVLGCVFWAILLAAGVVLLVKSKAVAGWISDRLDQ
jgi:hypothetical protein